MFLPVALRAYHAPATCAPQVLYTFPSVGYSPSGMAYDAATDRLFIANRDGPDGGSLAVVIGQSGDLIQLVTGLSSAHDVAYDAARGLIYVVGWDWLFVVDGSTYAVSRTIQLGTNMGAFGVAYNPANSKLYVSGFNNRTIVVVDVATLTILRTIADSRSFPISDPTYIAVNPNNNKAYVVNHTGGPYGWLVVLDGATNGARQVVPAPDADHGGDFYGIAVDSVHNRVYVTSISQAYLYSIDSATDIPSPWAVKIVRASNPPGRQIPLRMVAVNPNVGGLTHVWLTSISIGEPEDFWGLDRLMLLSFDSWPPASPVPMATEVASSPIYGLTLDPGTGRVFVSNANSNLVTVSQDMATLCSTPLGLRAASPDSGAWAVVVPAYGSSTEEHRSSLRAR
jgi:DNA-binding beta-propeller fold protein YncE